MNTLNEFLITGAIGMYFENFSVEAALSDERTMGDRATTLDDTKR